MTARFRRVGIAMACYEPALDTFAAQLESIARQTHQDWICVLSFDSPLRNIKSSPRMERFREDKRFKWMENANRLGHKKNFERAIQECASLGVDAIACSDQDDVWYPKKLEKLLAALNQAPALSLVHSDLDVLRGERIQKATAWKIERRGVKNVNVHHLIVRNVVAGCAMLMDAKLARQYPRIPDGAAYHDHWYAALAALNGKVIALNESLLSYRQHDSNVVGVTPYAGVLALGETRTPWAIVRKCVAAWRRSRDLARSLDDVLRASGARLSSRNRTMYLSNADLGVTLFVMGLRKLRSDPALARASLARAIGKALDLAVGRMIKS